MYVLSNDLFDVKYIFEMKEDVDVKNKLELNAKVDLFCRTQFTRSLCRLSQPLLDADVKRIVNSIESELLTR